MKLKMCELILCQGFIILIHETSSFINKLELIISLKKLLVFLQDFSN